MVRITFDVDDDVMRADADNEVSEARRGLLVETYFEFPVHFVVGDTDLLRASGQRDSDVQLPTLRCCALRGMLRLSSRSRERGPAHSSTATT